MRQGFWIVLVCILAMSGLAPSAMAEGSSVTNPLIDRADALRVQVATSGLQQVDGAQLQAAGWDLGTINPRTIHVWRAGQEVPLEVTGIADGRLDAADTIRFISPRTTSRYSTIATYWLSYDTTDGMRASPQLSPGDSLRWEEDTHYDSRWASVQGDHWFGHELVTTPDRSTASVQLAVPTSIPSGSRLHIGLSAKSAALHTLAIRLNGRALSPITWSSAGAYLATAIVPATILPGSLQIDLQLTSPGPTIDSVLVDYLELPEVRPAYPSTPSIPTVTRGAGVDPSRGPAPGQSGATYLIITHAALRSALNPLIAAHQQLGDTVGVVDVQTAYDAWAWGDRDPEAIRSLIRTAVASWQPAPRAVLLVGAGSVRMRTLPGQADPTLIPPYLVEADQSRGEIACDTCYTRLDTADPLGDLLPDLPIGRFPARSLADAQALVRKTVTYLTAPPGGAWQTRALLLTDNDRERDGRADPAGSFVTTAETAAAALPRGMQVQRFFYAPDRPTGAGYYQDSAELRCRLMRAIDGGSKYDTACPQLPANTPTGAAVWVYVGHASQWQWATTTPDSPTPYLWYVYDADARTNGDRLPILLSMTCLSGDFANPSLMTTDERLVLWPQGGAVASLAASGEGVNTVHAVLLQGVLPRLFAQEGGRRSLGEAHLDGLREVVTAGHHVDLVFSFGILGDPDVALPFVPTSIAWVPLARR